MKEVPRFERVKIRYNEEAAVRTTYELRERAARSQLRASASDRLSSPEAVEPRR